MRPSNLKLKNDSKPNLKSKKKLVIQEEPISNSRFKNEAFQKLYERNNASKDRLNASDNNTSRKNYHDSRSNSKLKDNKNSQKRFNISQKRNNNNLQNNNTRSKKIYRLPYNPRKFKFYPNLIGGVLNQVNYYNTNNNNNYNDNVRYKPIETFFNEQSSINSVKKEKENNNNSPNISFNSDNQNVPKNDNNENNINNIRKIKVDEVDYNDNGNANDNIYNNYNIENEMKVNADSIKNRKNDVIKKNGKSISPIISPLDSNEVRMNKESNDNIDQYVYNNNDKSDEGVQENNYNMPLNEERKDDNINNYNNNYDYNINENNINLRNAKKANNFTPTQFNVEQNENEENNAQEEIQEDKINVVNKKIDLLAIEKINNFMIFNNFKNYFNDLEKIPTNIFSINNDKEYIFDNLEAIKYDDINYIGKKTKKGNKSNIEDEDGKLTFNNDDEVLHYIKKKIREEKDNEYNKDKVKYNYFILTKKFHGKALYEIGLENNLNYINSILEKENVEIEREPVIFITKKELEKLKNNQQENNFTNSNEEIESLKKENEKLKAEIDLINKNYEEKNTNLINDYNNLYKEYEKLYNYNKEIENEINNKQNIINEYKIKIDENENKINECDKILEDYNRLKKEREKFIKYINELNEYDEKVILEYQKVKQQLEIEKQKNNLNNNNTPNTKKYFTNEELEIENNNQIPIPVIYNTEGSNEEEEREENIEEEINQNNYDNNNNYDEYDQNNNNVETAYDPHIKEDANNIKVVKFDDNGKENEIQELKNKKKVTFEEENDELKNKKREESWNRAMKRINNNKRRMDKISEDKKKVRKSDKIKGMAGSLEDRLKNNEGKLYVDLEYEQNKDEQENYNY